VIAKNRSGVTAPTKFPEQVLSEQLVRADVSETDDRNHERWIVTSTSLHAPQRRMQGVVSHIFERVRLPANPLNFIVERLSLFLWLIKVVGDCC
jgi:hypothetical protein